MFKQNKSQLQVLPGVPWLLKGNGLYDLYKSRFDSE